MRAAVRRSASARPGWRSTATTWPSPSISAARCVVLPPGAAHRSSTGSPGCGSSVRATTIAARDCGMNRPALPERRTRTRRTARRARGPRAGRSAGCDGDRQPLGEPGGVDPQRVGPQRGLGRLVAGAPSARAPPRGPRVANHSSAIHSGCECRSAASAGVVSGSAAISARASRAARRRTAFTSPAPRGESGLTSSTDSPTAAWCGDAVEERELEDAEAQRGQHRGLEPAHRAPGERGDHVVERRAPLHGAVRQPGRERAIAWRQAEPRRLGVERAIGVRAVLEHAPHDGVGAGARGGGRGSARPQARGVRLRSSGGGEPSTG